MLPERKAGLCNSVKFNHIIWVELVFADVIPLVKFSEFASLEVFRRGQVSD